MSSYDTQCLYASVEVKPKMTSSICGKSDKPTDRYTGKIISDPDGGGAGGGGGRHNENK